MHEYDSLDLRRLLSLKWLISVSACSAVAFTVAYNIFLWHLNSLIRFRPHLLGGFGLFPLMLLVSSCILAQVLSQRILSGTHRIFQDDSPYESQISVFRAVALVRLCTFGGVMLIGDMLEVWFTLARGSVVGIFMSIFYALIFLGACISAYPFRGNLRRFNRRLERSRVIAPQEKYAEENVEVPAPIVVPHEEQELEELRKFFLRTFTVAATLVTMLGVCQLLGVTFPWIEEATQGRAAVMRSNLLLGSIVLWAISSITARIMLSGKFRHRVLRGDTDAFRTFKNATKIRTYLLLLSVLVLGLCNITVASKLEAFTFNRGYIIFYSLYSLYSLCRGIYPSEENLQRAACEKPSKKSKLHV